MKKILPWIYATLIVLAIILFVFLVSNYSNLLLVIVLIIGLIVLVRYNIFDD